MKDSLPKCDRCNSPITDSIEVQIKNHEKVKLGKHISGSLICNECLAERDSEEKHSTISTIRNDINNIYHEHIGAVNKSDVFPNTPNLCSSSRGSGSHEDFNYCSDNGFTKMQELQKATCSSCGTRFVAETATATLCPSCAENQKHHSTGCGCGH